MQKRILIGFLILFLAVLGMNGCASGIPDETNHVEPLEESVAIEALVAEEGFYTSPEEVAEYIQLFGKLPGNYLTKKEARDLGWVSEDGNLWEVTDQMSIGGDRFGNREGLLPKSDDRQWFECDANYTGGYRGAERLVFSNDGLVFYTADHYESFEEIRRIEDEND
jgi:hypothetical protein